MTDPSPDQSRADDAAPAQQPPKPAVDPARAMLARARADARTAPRPGARRSPRGGAALPRSGSGPDERDPQPLDKALRKLTAEHGWEVEVAVHAVLARWPELVGTEIADHSEAERFADGELTVRADSTAWATQLRLLAPQLVAQINTQVGAGTVRFVKVRGPDAPRWSHGGRSVRDGRGPRDTYG